MSNKTWVKYPKNGSKVESAAHELAHNPDYRENVVRMGATNEDDVWEYLEKNPEDRKYWHDWFDGNNNSL